MWQRIVQIVSAIFFFAAVVGLITIPDDAQLWPERFGPLLAAMTKDDLIIALIAMSSIGMAWTIFEPQITELIRRRNAAPFQIDFSDDAPTQSLFSPYRATGILGLKSEDSDGVKIDGCVFRQLRSFSARNVTSATAKKVRADVVRVINDGTFVTDTRVVLKIVSQNTDENIQPDDKRLFALLEFLSPFTGGLPGVVGPPPQAIPEQELEYLRSLASENWVAPHPYGLPNLGIPFIDEGAQIGLPPKGHETWIDVAVYADDMPATLARFVLKRNEEVKVSLADQGLSLPKLKKLAVESH